MNNADLATYEQARRTFIAASRALDEASDDYPQIFRQAWEAYMDADRALRKAETTLRGESS